MKETLEFDSLTELAKFLKGKLENKRIHIKFESFDQDKE